MKIYVQVPITGRAIDEARKEAAELAAKVREAGHEAVTPFDLGIAEDATSQQALPRCIEALLACDALLLHPANGERTVDGDLPSRGCMAEALTAMTYHLGIYVAEAGKIRRARTSEITLTPIPLIMDYAESILFVRQFGEKGLDDSDPDGAGTLVGNIHSLGILLGHSLAKCNDLRKAVSAANDWYKLEHYGTDN